MIKRIFLLLSVGIITTLAVKAQKIAIAKGQKLEAASSTKMIMNLEVAGQAIDFTTETANTTQLELKDIIPAGYLFTNTTTRMVMHANGMGQETSFDSDKKEDLDGQVGQAMKGSIGKEQKITVDKQGKIVEMDLDTSGATGGGMNEMMNMTGGMMKGQAFPLLAQLPGRAIKTGDSWTDSTGTPATIKTVTTYTLKDINKGEAVFSFTGTMAKKGTIEQQGMQFDIDMAGTVKGEATYETVTGLLIKSNSTNDIKGNVVMMGQTAPMTMTITMDTTAKKL